MNTSVALLLCLLAVSALAQLEAPLPDFLDGEIINAMLACLWY